MKRFLFLFFLVISLSIVSFAQMENIYGNFDQYKTVINPGYVGMDGNMNFTAFSSLDNFKFANAGFKQYSFSFDMPISKLTSGIGGDFNSNHFGPEISYNISLSYSYVFEFEKSRLGIGFSPGLYVYEWESRNMLTGISYMERKSIAGLRLGTYFSSNKFYAGLSTKIRSSVKTYEEAYYGSILKLLYLNAGYMFDFNDSDFTLTPSFLVETDFSVLALRVSGAIDYKNIVKFGVNAEKGDSYSTFIEFTVFDALTIGYCQNLTFSDLSAYTYRNHEFLLKYIISRKE